jgi:prepilin-type N-terminal cleavage/methylation domain-containing protein
MNLLSRALAIGIPPSRKWINCVDAKTGRNRAFTLVEIMIVASIIGLLAAVVVPSYYRSVAASQKSACIANLSQIEGAIQQWATEFKKANGSPVTKTDIIPFLKGNRMPAEPAGGDYTLSTVDAPPECTNASLGHTLN